MRINLGCGITGYKQGFLNVDISPEAKPDIVADVRIVPWTWAEINKVDYIAADNLFEHIEPDTLIKVVKECHRVLKPGGVLWIQVPICTADNLDAALGDPTHKNFFTLITFDYYDYKHPRWRDYGRLYGIPKWERIKQERRERFLVVELKAIKEDCK